MTGAYGYCPRCGGLGISRERRLNGNDRCENGHSYPSMSAVANPLLPVSADLPVLVAEVERLRSINDDYLLEMGRQHALLRDQKRGENAERAAVVAALRRFEPGPMGLSLVDMASVADAIERGDHRRKEEE